MTNKKRFPFQPRRPGFNIICLEIQKDNPTWTKKKVMEEAKRRYVPVEKVRKK